MSKTGTPVASAASTATGSPTDITSGNTPLHIGSVALTVRDLETLSLFYQKAIGLQPIETDAGRHRLGVGGRTLLELRHDPEASPADRRDAGLFHTAFLLPTRADLADWLVHAHECGASLQGASDHLVSKALYLADPEGNGIEIYHDRPSQEWQLDGSGQIMMETLRLDLHELARSAGSRSFQGFPDGTIVGHVHLQVGDLNAAEAFYGDLIGFKVSCRYRGATFMGSGGYHHHIGTNIWNSRGAGKRPARTTGLAEIGFVAERPVLEALAAKLKAFAINETEDRLTVCDPWGTDLSFAVA